MHDLESFVHQLLPAPVQGGFAMEGYWVWCGSPIQGEDGNYHLFASRWPKSFPMHPGWTVASEVVRAVSPTPEGPYTFQEVVLPARGAKYWDGRSTHCPSIHKWGDTYVLFYIGMTHPFPDIAQSGAFSTTSPECTAARASKRVGVAYADSVFGPWKRLDKPIFAPRPDKFDSFFVSNPAPTIARDGSVVLVYKARAYLEPPYENGHYAGQIYGDMTLGVATAPHFLGPYQQYDEPIFSADQSHLEDPFIWQDADGVFRMVAKDMDGRVCGEFHGGVCAHSQDGIHWTLEHGKLAYSRTFAWDDGETRTMGSLERPNMLIEDGKPTHLFFATADGPGLFTEADNTWNLVIPLKK